MQNLENYSQADAQRILESMEGIIVDIIEIPSEKSAGTVIHTIPSAGMQIRSGETVTVYVSNGVHVNTVETVTTDQIREENKGKGNNVKTESGVSYMYQSNSDDASPNVPPQTQPITVSIPNLHGQSVPDALEELSRIELECIISYCYSEIYDKNLIAHQSRTPGEQVDKGTYLEIWISMGNPDEAWSDWSETVPSGDYEIKSSTQYRYRTRTSYQENVYGNWSSTVWHTSPLTTSDTRQYIGERQVETQKHYKTQYLYSRWCGYYNGSKRFGATESDIAACTNRWNEDTGWLDYALPVIGTSSGSSGAVMYEGYWYNQTTQQVYTYSDYRTEYGYQTRDKDVVTKYTAWGDWSSWSFTSVSSSDTREINTRIVYQYRQNLPSF